jgi:hypothetical protein
LGGRRRGRTRARLSGMGAAARPRGFGGDELEKGPPSGPVGLRLSEPKVTRRPSLSYAKGCPFRDRKSESAPDDDDNDSPDLFAGIWPPPGPRRGP